MKVSVYEIAHVASSDKPSGIKCEAWPWLRMDRARLRDVWVGAHVEYRRKAIAAPGHKPDRVEGVVVVCSTLGKWVAVLDVNEESYQMCPRYYDGGLECKNAVHSACAECDKWRKP